MSNIYPSILEKLAARNIDIYHYEDIVRCYALAKLNIEHSGNPAMIGTDKDRMLNNFGKFNQIVATSVCHMCKYESAYIAWNVFTIEVIIPAKQNPA